jgi:hypothetical protein
LSISLRPTIRALETNIRKIGEDWQFAVALRKLAQSASKSKNAP